MNFKVHTVTISIGRSCNYGSANGYLFFPNKLTVAYAVDMAKQTLNANISSSSGADVNVGYVFE